MTSWCKIILKHIDYYLKTTDFFLKTIQYIITVNECHDITDHCQLPCLFNSLIQANNKETFKLCITGPLCGETTSGPVVSHHNGPVMQKAFQSHDII